MVVVGGDACAYTRACTHIGSPVAWVWRGTTSRVGNAFCQDGVLKGPGGGVHRSLGVRVTACVWRGEQQVLDLQ